MFCAAGLAGLGGLAASTEADARTSSPGPAAETRAAAFASVEPNLRPDLLITPSKIGGVTLTERELVRGVKVAMKGMWYR